MYKHIKGPGSEVIAGSKLTVEDISALFIVPPPVVTKQEDPEGIRLLVDVLNQRYTLAREELKVASLNLPQTD